MSIRISGHHLKILEYVYYFSDYVPYDFMKLILKNLYGDTFTEKVYAWIKSLDVNTEIEVITHYDAKTKKFVPDSICELGCPYLKGHKRGSYKLVIEAFKRNPIFFPFVLLGLVKNSDEDELMKRGLEPGKKYKLKDILQTRVW